MCNPFPYMDYICANTACLVILLLAPPDAVNILNITTTLVSLNHIRINWTAPASNNAPITSYNVTYCIADPITMNTIGSEISAVVTTTSADFAPMTLNRMYRVSFVATNSVGRSPPNYYFMNATTSSECVCGGVRVCDKGMWR